MHLTEKFKFIMEDFFAQYHEDLLRAQYKVSEIVQQKLPRGTIREDFLCEHVLKRKGSLRCNKGMVLKDGVQSGECDLIFYESSSPVNPMGSSQIFIEPKFCKLILEVKSNATGSDLKKTNQNFQKIKSIDPSVMPLCGVFCYNTKLDKKTILGRFGWGYDKEVMSWVENQSLTLAYPHVDFIICIASSAKRRKRIEKQFFITRDTISGRYFNRQEFPIIKNFFGVTDNL